MLDLCLSFLHFIEDEDYSAIVVPVSLTPMAARECFDVPINNDMIFELTEYFNVSLALEGTLPAAASLDITRARVHIIDDEGNTSKIYH